MSDNTSEPNIVEAIKRSAEGLRELLQAVETYIDEQHQHAHATEDVDEMQRLHDSTPYRWLDDARHSLQCGMMFAERAIKQPTSF